MNQSKPFGKQRLFCPGPTPVSLAAQLAAMAENPYHRSEPFYKTFRHCRELLAQVLASKSSPLILTASGTGAMEAAVTYITAPKEQVIILNGGKFGERWTKICQAFGCQCLEIKFPWGETPPLAILEAQLKAQPGVKAVFFQAHETSTGVSYPVAEISALIRRASQALVVVDGISAIGVEPFAMDAWGIDIAITSSQKGLGLPPGLAFINLSPRAWQQRSERPRFYFDLLKEQQAQEKGQTAFTPAISLIVMLATALDELCQYGLERIYREHAAVAEAVRAGIQAMGLRLFAKSHPSSALTSFWLPEGCDGKKLVRDLRQNFGMVFAGGQDQVEGKILRFAHMGLFDGGDIAAGLLAIETSLKRAGFPCEAGEGVKAFWAKWEPFYMAPSL